MPNDLSVWSMVLDASPIVQVVVAILLLASVASWAVIFRKSQVIGRSRRQAEKPLATNGAPAHQIHLRSAAFSGNASDGRPRRRSARIRASNSGSAKGLTK